MFLEEVRKITQDEDLTVNIQITKKKNAVPSAGKKVRAQAKKQQRNPLSTGKQRPRKKARQIVPHSPFDSYWKDKLHLYTPFI